MNKTNKNRAHFHQRAPAHIRIMNVRRNAKGAITAIAYQNATAEMAMRYRDLIITASVVNRPVRRPSSTVIGRLLFIFRRDQIEPNIVIQAAECMKSWVQRA